MPEKAVINLYLSNDRNVWDKNIVLNLNCKSVSSFRGVMLLWLGFSSPLSHCHLANVKQMSLPSYLWKKGNNFMPLTVQGRP